MFCLLLSAGMWGQTTFKKADSLFELGNYSKAIELYNQSEQAHRNYSKLAQCYQALGNYDRALSNYEQAVNRHQEDLILKYRYAKLLSALKRYERSEALFAELISKDSLNPNFHFEMGKLLEQQNDSLAMSFYYAAHYLDATHQKVIYKIAKQKLIKRKHSESLEYIEKGLKFYSDNVELISLKAQNYYWMEDYESAIKWFEKLLDFGEASELIYEKLSLSYYKNYELDKAITNRKKALSYNPLNADGIYVLGTYFAEKNDFETAESYISKALQIKDVSLSEEYQELGVVFNRQKKYAEAIAAFQKALKEDPKNMMADFFMAMSKDQYYKDIDARIKVFEDLKKKYGDSPLAAFAERRLIELKEEKFQGK
jgi:tetratricopeptide (TPR) repeat protein